MEKWVERERRGRDRVNGKGKGRCWVGTERYDCYIKIKKGIKTKGKVKKYRSRVEPRK